MCISAGLAADCGRSYTTMTREVEHDSAWVEQVFAEAGCQLLVQPQAERILDRLWAVKTGEIDFISAATPLPERAEYAWFSLPYRQERVVVLAHAELAAHVQIDSMASLVRSGRPIIGPHFGYYGPDWERTKEQLLALDRFRAYKSWSSASGMLIRKPDHLLVIVDDAARDILAKSRVPMQQLPATLYQTDVVFLFSRKTVSAADVAHVDQAIQRLLQRGVQPQ